MRLMIASDIHGSAFYCEQMLNAYRREGAQRLLILGDILYHGPRNALPEGYDPQKVAAMLNPMKDHLLCVRGNCDTEVDQMVLEFPIMADYCFLELSGGNSGEGGSTDGDARAQETGTDSGGTGSGRITVFATHGHVYHPEHLPPLKTGDILLTGHTHIPACQEITAMDGNRYWYLNPGSVSIPKEDSEHSYMICKDGCFYWKNMQGEEYKTWKTDSRF